MPGCALGQSFDPGRSASSLRVYVSARNRWKAAVDNIPERPKDSSLRRERDSELLRADLTDLRRNIRHIALEFAHRHLRQDSIRHRIAPDQVAKGDPAGLGNWAELRMLRASRLDRRLNGSRQVAQRNRDRLVHLIFPPYWFARIISAFITKS